jgi:hypothetical protein
MRSAICPSPATSRSRAALSTSCRSRRAVRATRS